MQTDSSSDWAALAHPTKAGNPATRIPIKFKDLTYKVVRSLGVGAGSTILLIQDSRSGAPYALKVVKRQQASDDIYIAQAIHEFDVAQRLNHPAILKIFDCREKRTWFRISGVELLMEYVEGKPLDELQGLKQERLVPIFIEVASALQHMHRRGIYHGDLKPGNIMVDRKGKARVIDFGTAWIKGQPKDRVQGTPQYMAPEQASRKTVDERTDIYNFGATMYRMFTGHYANLGMPLDDGFLGQLARPKPPLEYAPKIPGTLSEAIMACLEPEPDRRPAGIFEVRHKLVAVARYLGLSCKD